MVLFCSYSYVLSSFFSSWGCVCVCNQTESSRSQTTFYPVFLMLPTHLIYLHYFCCWAMHEQMTKGMNEWRQRHQRKHFFRFKRFIQFAHLNTFSLSDRKSHWKNWAEKWYDLTYILKRSLWQSWWLIGN